MGTAATEIIQYGQFSDNSLLDEPDDVTPVIKVESLTLSFKRTETLYKNRESTTKRAKYTDPIAELAYSGYVISDSGLSNEHPGNQVLALNNYANEMHGFDPSVGTMVYIDPERSLAENEEDATLDFTVRHFPFVES